MSNLPETPLSEYDKQRIDRLLGGHLSALAARIEALEKRLNEMPQWSKECGHWVVYGPYEPISDNTFLVQATATGEEK